MSYIISLILIPAAHSLSSKPTDPLLLFILCTCFSFCLETTLLPDSHTLWVLHEPVWVFSPSFNLGPCSNMSLKAKRSTLTLLYKIDHCDHYLYPFPASFLFSFLTLITTCICCEGRALLLLFAVVSQPLGYFLAHSRLSTNIWWRIVILNTSSSFLYWKIKAIIQSKVIFLDEYFV